MLPWLARAARAAQGVDGAASPAAVTPMARGFELGLKVVLAGLLPVGLALVLFARPLISLLYGAGYAGAVGPLQLLGLGCALYGVHTFASTAFIAADAPATFARLVAAVVAGNLAINLVAIPRYGADGAAGTALLSGAALAVAGVALVRRRGGPLRLSRVLLGPLAGAAAMTAVALALPLPFVPCAVA